MADDTMVYTLDDLIGGSHFHNATCGPCLRFGYLSVITTAAAIYKALEREGVANVHTIMDKICEENGINKMHLLHIINGEEKNE